MGQVQNTTTSREKILKQVRQALMQPSPAEVGDVDKDSEIFAVSDEPLEIQFAQNFLEINGKFVFCENEADFIENISFVAKDNNWSNVFCLDTVIKDLLNTAQIPFSDKEPDFLKTDVGLTLCECLVARTGSVVVSSKQISGRRLPIYPNVHVVIAYTSQLVYNVKDALKLIREKYSSQLPSMITTISGPSRTADIEKTLVMGAHGPKDIFVFLIDDLASVSE